MTYRVYIRNDYKAEISNSALPLRPLSLCIISAVIVTLITFNSFRTDTINQEPVITERITAVSPLLSEDSHNDADSIQVEVIEFDPSLNRHDEIGFETIEPITYEHTAHEHSEPLLQDEVLAREVDIATEQELLGVFAEENNRQLLKANRNVHNVTVKKGDSMAIIFNRLSLSPVSLHTIMSLGKTTAVLKSIKPGELIKFEIEDGQLNSLSYDYGLTKTLHVRRNEKQYEAEIVETEIEKRIRYATAEIKSSLFLAGQRAGITDKVIMNLVGIYGWDIDFALDIRSGDKFAIIFEEHFKNGEKVNNGPILAAEFINQGYKFRAVRYTHDNGDVNYYSDTGHNMRKAFMRTPVNFSRISSRFNLKRRHPVLNTIRAHRGVDYAARTGTPIKATGDGIVNYKGTKGGYGRTVILKHGGTYTTLYAHMSKYAKGIKTGTRVKQGQIIGYVGSSGLATGPHLHYEFRINGVHRNPLKVKLPKAMKIPDAIMADFKQQTQPILAQLDQYINQSNTLASLPIAESDNSQILAMRESDESPESITQ